MFKKLKKRLIVIDYMTVKKIVPILVGLFILLLIIWFADPVVIISHFSKSDMKYIAIAFAVSNVLVLLRVVRWKVLLSGVGFTELFPVQLLGMSISNLTPGKIGEPAKALILKMRKGIAVSESLPTIIWERIIDVSILILLSFAAVQFISSGSRLFTLGLVGVCLFALLIIILLLILYNRGFGMRVVSFLRRWAPSF